MTSPKDRIISEADAIIEGVHALAELGKKLATEAEQLESRIRALEWDGNGHADLAAGTKANAKKAMPRNPIDQELYNRVHKMLESEPMRLTQLMEVTGASANTLKVIITKMQREGVHIVNVGAANKALWFIPSKKVSDRLARARTEER